jgi:hypothetical protein
MILARQWVGAWRPWDLSVGPMIEEMLTGRVVMKLAHVESDTSNGPFFSPERRYRAPSTKAGDHGGKT